MNIIVCLDDSNAMMFNNRRQSQDKNVIKDITNYCNGKTLFLNEYSAKLFLQYDNLNVSDTFLEIAKNNDICFVENKSLLQYIDKIESIIIYRWNRTYPYDTKFDIDVNDNNIWTLQKVEEFKGYSHDKITKEVYTK